ncbi:hypothetical protein B0H17DRAFT_1142751 [Mycena rosella]|uniref:Uncharacterized protein n=1 Tax=Mycena rosella TaxID=1033263 RepID=A0AAD7CWM6_MYCRO|nr:hypothetical protein B0H17DRAFT_1142751 [Mycena rosella]
MFFVFVFTAGGLDITRGEVAHVFWWLSGGSLAVRGWTFPETLVALQSRTRGRSKSHSAQDSTWLTVEQMNLSWRTTSAIPSLRRLGFLKLNWVPLRDGRHPRGVTYWTWLDTLDDLGALMVPCRRGLVFIAIKLAADTNLPASDVLMVPQRRGLVFIVLKSAGSTHPDSHEPINALMVPCCRGLVFIALKSADSMHPDSYELIPQIGRVDSIHYQGRLICLSAALMVPRRPCLAASSSSPSKASQLHRLPVTLSLFRAVAVSSSRDVAKFSRAHSGAPLRRPPARGAPALHSPRHPSTRSSALPLPDTTGQAVSNLKEVHDPRTIVWSDVDAFCLAPLVSLTTAYVSTGELEEFSLYAPLPRSFTRTLEFLPPTKRAQVFAVADAVLNVWIRPHDTNLREGFVGSLRSTSAPPTPRQASGRWCSDQQVEQTRPYFRILVAALLPTLLVSPPAFLVQLLLAVAHSSSSSLSSSSSFAGNPTVLGKSWMARRQCRRAYKCFRGIFGGMQLLPDDIIDQPPSPSDKPGLFYDFVILNNNDDNNDDNTEVVKFGRTAHPTKRPRLESLIHEHLKRAGAWLGPSKCGFCPVYHLEKYDYRRCGGRDAVVEVVETYLRRLRWAIVRYDMSA